MPYYAVPGSQGTVSSSLKTGAQVNATGSNKRGKVFEIIVGAISNPNSTDCAVTCDVSRITATGAGAYTPWTPTLLDTADGAAVNVAGVNATAEATTITANSSLWNVGMNQRATVRWIAAQESQYLVWAATSGTGLILRVSSATLATSFDTQFTFME